MPGMKEEQMVPARVVIEKFGIPEYALYRLIKAERIRFHQVQQKVWRTRPQYMFLLSEVAADLGVPLPE